MVITESFFIESAATGRFRRCTPNQLSRDNALTVNNQESIEERLFRFSFVVFLFLQGLLSGKVVVDGDDDPPKEEQEEEEVGGRNNKINKINSSFTHLVVCITSRIAHG